MGFILLLISVLLFFIIFYGRISDQGSFTKIRLAFIYSLITNAALVWLYNELFSFFDLINTKTALAFWLVEVLALGGYFFIKRNNLDLSGLRDACKLKGLGKSDRLIIFVSIVVYILPLLFLAVYSAPNNYDSHMYHLHRINAWISNGNLDHFPTMHLQQLYLNVFAEYLVLDTVLLFGSDQMAGLVQFSAFIGSLCGISLLAKRFGLNQSGQLLAAILLLTLPISIFESTSTQVDYCACFFFISFVYFGFSLLDRKSTLTLFAFLVALAFGGFSKYTIFIFAIPFTAYFAIRILLQYHFFYGMKVLAIAVVVMLVTFGPFFYRNYTLFGHIMSPLRNTVFASEELPANKHGLRYTLSGIVKNAGLNVGVPVTAVNRAVENGILSFHDVIGVDINDEDLRVDAFAVKFSVHEDMIPNTVHFGLIIISGILLFFLKGRRDVKWFWTLAVLGFLLFCTLMKFQAWSTRTQMPFFAMGTVLIAFVFTKKWRISSRWLALPMLVLSSVFVYSNPSKELIPINFLTRKLIGHIPVAICENGGEQARFYEQYLGEYYVFPGNDNCHPLKSWPDYQTRLKVFDLLDKVGYYDLDKSSNILTMDRSKAYFLSHPDNYNGFEPLLEHIAGGHNVGIFFKNHVGFYHYWAAVDHKTGHAGEMNYIRYNQELMVLKNAQKDFCYDYILSDDPESLKQFLPKSNVDTIYTTRLFQLVKLKKPSCDRSLF